MSFWPVFYFQKASSKTTSFWPVLFKQRGTKRHRFDPLKKKKLKVQNDFVLVSINKKIKIKSFFLPLATCRQRRRPEEEREERDRR